MKLLASKGRRPFAVTTLLVLLGTARCVLPRGDDDLPKTDVEGVNRDAVLRILIAPSDRRVGALLPLTVDVAIANSKADEGDVYCVKLVSDPGTVSFPFSDCGDESAAGGSGGSDTGGAGHTAMSCLSLRAERGGLGARAVASYSPEGSEPIATVIGALYGNATCTGQALQQTAVVLRLTDAQPAAGGAGGAGGEASEGGSAGAPVGGAPVGGSSMGGTGPGGSGGSTVGGSGGSAGEPNGGAAGMSPGDGGQAGGS